MSQRDQAKALMLGGALVYALAMFLPWLKNSDYDVSLNGFKTGDGPAIGLLACIAVAVIVLVRDFGMVQVRPGWGGSSLPAIVVLAAGLALGVVAIRLGVGADNDLDRGIGIFIAFIGAGAQFGGAVLYGFATTSRDSAPLPPPQYGNNPYPGQPGAPGQAPPLGGSHPGWTTSLRCTSGLSGRALPKCPAGQSSRRAHRAARGVAPPPPPGSQPGPGDHFGPQGH
ncbi:MAG: hypothetical protein H6512_14110 [Acidimicrobiia bacterium]|nr:hypothetical protein [Acidimicrobiia bacterium]